MREGRVREGEARERNWAVKKTFSPPFTRPSIIVSCFSVKGRFRAFLPAAIVAAFPAAVPAKEERSKARVGEGERRGLGKGRGEG